jgi:hypothetical protein
VSSACWIMPDYILTIIPSDPEYIPPPAAQHMAFALFSSFVGTADEVSAAVAEDIEFIDPGENFESVTCPACGTDLGGWWQEAMAAAFAKQFSDLVVEVPCCGAQGSLNDLNYSWPAGFARFRLQARNPITDIEDNQLGLLSGIMKCEVRKIWTHY